jgi:predicted ATPase/DNA-binding winged helix-turn-helix (wHTH) protein
LAEVSLRIICVIPHAHWRCKADAIVTHDAVLLLLAERTMEAGQESTEGFAFGRFRIFPRQRRMLVGDEPVELGSRAFDLLVALIEARGTVISKDALMSRVWQNLFIADNNLQAQISALRKAFGVDRHLIRTVAGRGYQFTGEVRSLSGASRERAHPGDTAAKLAPAPTNLPAPVSDLIGRDLELREVVSLAGSHRLVTLTGAGGVGKTRLALEAARQLLPQFRDGVWIAELSPLSDPNCVPAAIAAAVGIELAAGDASAETVAAALSAKELLIVLDTCEHVINAAAEMAEALLRASARARVIATSREALTIDGEWVYPMRPLPVPADNETDPLNYRAVSLFVARAQAADLNFSAERCNAAAIAAICRRVDGIPLAIELAAARAATLGIYSLADRLYDHLQLLTCGRRTALPRHQTLHATLDWSYELLTHPERAVLRRLGIFRGAFGLDAARAVAAGGDITPSDATEGLCNLVAKSLASAEVGIGIARYRLLETTRAYALEKLAESGEFDSAARRHAEYYRDLNLFEPAEPVRETHPPTESRTDPAEVTWQFAA